VFFKKNALSYARYISIDSRELTYMS